MHSVTDNTSSLNASRPPTMPHKLQTMSCPPRGHHHLFDLSAVLPAPQNPSSCISAIPGRAAKSSVGCWRVKVVLQAVALNIMHARSSIIARHPDVTLLALVRVASVVHDERGSVQSNQSPLAAKTPVPPHPLHTERKYDAQRPSHTRAWAAEALVPALERRWESTFPEDQEERATLAHRSVTNSSS